MPKEQLIKLLEIYKDSFDKNGIEVDISKIKKSSILVRKLGLSFSKSKSTIHNLKTKHKQNKNLKFNNKYDELVIKSLNKINAYLEEKNLKII
ncbi:hypothetical protein [Mycoplasmopsis gallinarum]|uniref:hypothetical protein n=1 Tax=Mycoplasmopsis gallinarum TaxID=29557 RepID=UPI00047FD953|nr:hypothetical protein [Mycoplasmopsis gallinarum]